MESNPQNVCVAKGFVSEWRGLDATVDGRNKREAWKNDHNDSSSLLAGGCCWFYG